MFIADVTGKYQLLADFIFFLLCFTAALFKDLMAALLPVLYLLYVYRATLQGMGNTFLPMMSGFVELIMRVGAAMVLPGLIGYPGLFWAEVCAWVGADFVLLPGYYHMIRKAELSLQSQPKPE